METALHLKCPTNVRATVVSLLIWFESNQLFTANCKMCEKKTLYILPTKLLHSKMHDSGIVPDNCRDVSLVYISLFH